MKCTRKLASLLLALVMVFALAVTVAADDTGTTATTGTITVANPVADRTYTAYKVFDVTYDENGHYSYTLPVFTTDDFSWYSAVRRYSQKSNSGLIEHVVGTDDTETGAESIFFTTDENFSPADFAAYLKGRLGVDRPTGHVLTEKGDGTVSVSGLPLGYYFVASDTGALCNLTTTNPTATIHDKTDMPFKKVVDKTNVDVGQTVTYTITGKVPDYNGFDTYIYEIEDTMSDGLTYLRETLKIKVGGKLVSGGPDFVTIWTQAVNGRTDAPNYLKVALNVKKFKVGDPILFNDSGRFSVLYNNMKGRILSIQDSTESVYFTVEIDALLDELEVLCCYGLDYIGNDGGKTQVGFNINRTKPYSSDEERTTMEHIVPFQIAYAVSIHKAQGLEYDSVKIVIADETEDQITHNIFYTAITRAKQHLTIYWSPEVCNRILARIRPVNYKRDFQLLKAKNNL